MCLPALVKTNKFSRADHQQLLSFAYGVSSAETGRLGKTTEKEAYDK